MIFEELPARLQRKLVITDDGCWLWTGFKLPKGYGRVRWEGKTEQVHRVTYMLANGVWPRHEGHHTCEVKACANPEHVKDKTSAAHHAEHLIDRCRRAGHLYTPENTYVNSAGSRICVACRRERDGTVRPYGLRR